MLISAELGVPDGGLVSFIGILVPAGTPDHMVRTLRYAITDALAQPALRARVEETGSMVADAEAATPAGFAATLRREAEFSRRAAPRRSCCRGAGTVTAGSRVPGRRILSAVATASLTGRQGSAQALSSTPC